MQQTIQPLASSFRDPSGFVFEKEGTIYRQVNKIFKEHFDHFINSGCYDHLIKNGWLVAHEEVPQNLTGTENWYKTLKPQKIAFISYSYEWCFDMLKDAALLTLQLVRESIPFGMILKDATPFNVQWLSGKPIFIDTLSFEKYDTSKPWIAYRQFCENFLSPLLLMYHSRQPLQNLLLVYPDGIPLPVTKSLLPWKSKFSFYTYLHIHLHERISSKSAGKESPGSYSFSEKKLLRLIESLQSLVQSLKWKGKQTNWENYYEEAGQRGAYLTQKKKIVTGWLKEIPAKTTLDLGANTGEFSFLAAKENAFTLATDYDHSAINKLYQAIKEENEKNILPLAIDIANPSPSIGFSNIERMSYIERTRVDVSLALALIHHLAIGKNISFEKIVELFKEITSYLIIEFIPKQDEKVQFMLRQKADIYSEYTEDNFTKAFEKYFTIIKKEPVENSGRVIFLMKKI
jgi:hypothetical protein